MTKHELVRKAITDAIEGGATIGWDRAEMLFALVVTTIETYAAESGNDAVADVLEFELSSLRDTVDTVFLRSR